MIRELALGRDAGHRLGVVHLGLSPEQVVVGANGIVKLRGWASTWRWARPASRDEPSLASGSEAQEERHGPRVVGVARSVTPGQQVRHARVSLLQ